MMERKGGEYTKMRRFFGDNCVSIAAVLVFSVLVSVFFGVMAYGEKAKYEAERASDAAADMLALAGAVSRAAHDDGGGRAELLVLIDRSGLSERAKCGIRRAVHDAESGDFAAIAELDRMITASSCEGGGIGKNISDAIEEYFSDAHFSPLAEYSGNDDLPSVAPRSLHINELSAKDKKCRSVFFGNHIKMKHCYIRNDLSANAEYTNNAYFICSVGDDNCTQIWNPVGIKDRCLSFTDVENEIGEIIKTVHGGAGTLSLISCGLHGDTVFYSFSDTKRAFSLLVGVSADSGEIVLFASSG